MKDATFLARKFLWQCEKELKKNGHHGHQDFIRGWRTRKYFAPATFWTRLGMITSLMSLLFQRKVKRNITGEKGGVLWNSSDMTKRSQIFKQNKMAIKFRERNERWNDFIGRKSRAKPFTCLSISKDIQPLNYPIPSINISKHTTLILWKSVHKSANQFWRLSQDISL